MILFLYCSYLGNNRIEFNILIGIKNMVFILLRVVATKSKLLIRSNKSNWANFIIILLLLIHYSWTFSNNRFLYKYLVFTNLITTLYIFFQIFKVLIKVIVIVINLFKIYFVISFKKIFYKNFLINFNLLSKKILISYSKTI